MPKGARISHGSGQLRAQSFSVMTSDNDRCNAGCRFCISQLTPGHPCSKKRERRLCDEGRLRLGLGYAQYLRATHAILTGKADPSQEDPDYLLNLVRICRENLPLLDMHTNGYLFLSGKPNHDLLKAMVREAMKRKGDVGLSMITLSIASFDPAVNRALMRLKQSGAGLIPYALELGLLVRCSLVVNKQGAGDFEKVVEYIQAAGELGAHMVVVREVWRPKVYEVLNKEVAQWNHANWVDISAIQDQFFKAAVRRTNEYGLQVRDPLPWGTPVFVMDGVFSDREHGVNITFARCDEATTGPVLKSLVHMPDGHGRRQWDNRADIVY